MRTLEPTLSEEDCRSGRITPILPNFTSHLIRQTFLKPKTLFADTREEVAPRKHVGENPFHRI